MPHQKWIRVLNYVWLLVVFPVAVAILVGVLGHSVNLGIKTFLLIECGMAVLSPLLNAVINDGITRITTGENSLPRGRIRHRGEGGAGGADAALQGFVILLKFRPLGRDLWQQGGGVLLQKRGLVGQQC